MTAIPRDPAASERSLVDRAAAGDETAFAVIVTGHHSDMERVAFTVCGDPDIAHEAVAAAWLHAWRGLARIKDPDKLRPWLVAIAANEARQLVRKQTRRRLREIAVTSTAPTLQPAPGTDHLDLHDAIERLGPEDRTLLALRYVAGLSSTEIGPLLGLSGEGVRTRLARLMTRLRKDLDHA
jgi:RNA polymerase sigma-70 factor (ECF subfamily)